ncbi:MAG: AarF/ABC1/UbiB kinase family protein [Lachnospiraceae bacterium]|nr:AarF/ABC1/UbiB kinase family protein [Lachnospiraceae bacterium]MBR1567708.1 AarF/ABC1/UbiB kinase family protein [Lachnospiraceae bacterium]
MAERSTIIDIEIGTGTGPGTEPGAEEAIRAQKVNIANTTNEEEDNNSDTDGKDVQELPDYRECTLADLLKLYGSVDNEDLKELLKSDSKLPKSLLNENVARLQEITKILKSHELTRNELSPERLRMILEDLGPTFVKMGQIMSKRTDLLPRSYCQELENLCENSTPLSLEEVTAVVEEQLKASMRNVFRQFDEIPLGAASIGQVHKAVLKDGRQVVVKVQRPGVQETMRHDIMLLRKLVRPLKMAPRVGEKIDFMGMLEELWKVSQEELNYLIEAVHTIEFRNLNADEPGINCPEIIAELTTSKVMTMEYVEGFSIGDSDRLDREGYDRDALGKLMIQNYIKQVLTDGFFHADPHQGNIMIRGDELVWIDMGMTGTLSKQERSSINQGIRAMVKKDQQGLIRALVAMGAVNGELNYSKLYTDIDFLMDRYYVMDLGDMNIGEVFTDIIKVMKENNIVLPSGISMLARGLVVIEGVLSRLSPDTSIVKIAQTYVMKDMLRPRQLIKSVIQDATTMASSAEKAMEIPGLASDLIKNTLRGQTKINLDLESSRPLMEEFNRIMNHLIICIFAAALLLGSSLLCTTNMHPQILGIPALGFIGYLLAFVLGLYLIIKSHFGRKK